MATIKKSPGAPGTSKEERAYWAQRAITEQQNAIKAQLETEKLQIDMEDVRERHRVERSAPFHRKVYMFDEPVTESSVAACIQVLDAWHGLDPTCEMTIRFNSPGGDVIAGMYLFDYLRKMQRLNHRIITEAYGYAASMAGILLQVGDVRKMGREAYLLIHEISFSARGKMGDVEDEVKFVKKISERVLDIFAENSKRAKQAHTSTTALTKKQFAERWKRKDWWLDSVEALSLGIVDEVV